MAALLPPPSSAAASTSRVSAERVEKAVTSLLKWRSSKSKSNKPQLLEQDDLVYLVVTLKQIPPKGRTNAHKIPIPHPLLHSAAAAELCLIIDDRPKSSKLTSAAAKKKIKAEDIPIAKVIKLSKLKSDYKPHEAKRKLCDSYDMFFADKRVIPLLPKLLGKNFFKKKKIPLPVDLTHNNWKEQIERGCSSSLLYLKTGTCSVMRVGNSSMENGEIVENVVAAIGGVVELVPKKWNGVRSFHLKLSESVALPLYQVLPERKLKIEGKKKEDGVVEGESKEVEKVEGEKGGLNKKRKKKEKGKIHEVRYMDGEVGEFEDDEEEEEDVEGEKSEDHDVGGFENGGKKRKKGDSVSGKVASNSKGEKRAKKSASKAEMGEELGERKDKKDKKKGRIHEVRYMDGEAGEFEDDEQEEDVEGEKSENDDVGGFENGGKKRKKGATMIGKVASELKGEKRTKKSASKAEEGEESGGKKDKKGGVGKLKDGATEVKSMKSKKTNSS